METPGFSGNLGHLDIMLFKLGYKPENRNTAKGFDIRSVRSHTKLEQRFAELHESKRNSMFKLVQFVFWIHCIELGMDINQLMN